MLDSSLGGVLPGAGHRKCYDNSAVIECPELGEPFFCQDAQFGWDLDVTAEQRFDRFEAVEGQPVVSDRINHYEWQDSQTKSEKLLVAPC